jgi:hypothetical protein
MLFLCKSINNYITEKYEVAIKSVILEGINFG